MELTVLNFDSYPTALTWLDNNARGIAVNDSQLEWGGHLNIDSHIIFSELMPQENIKFILNNLPNYEQITLKIKSELDDIKHLSYLVRGLNRFDVIEILKSLGAVVKKSSCYLDPIISNEEMALRLQEIQRFATL